MRIWCRDHQSWLAFKTVNHDRFLVSPDGYFIELPDGSLTRISPRTCFPVISHLPSVPVSQLTARQEFGAEAYFIAAPLRPTVGEPPVPISLEALLIDPLDGFGGNGKLVSAERAVMLRTLENGVITRTTLGNILTRKNKSSESAGEVLIDNALCQWESILAHCLDVSPASKLDPPVLRALGERREWELLGEILVALRKINRTDLEYALKLKKDAMPALGQILTAMGACTNDDVKRCLKIQKHMKEGGNESIALIGKLLVSQKVITETDLNEALWKQHVSRQPLRQILLQMGACTETQIDAETPPEGEDFQQSVDETVLGQRLMKANLLSKEQLDDALRIQVRGRQVLGELLVSYQMCKNEDVEEVLTLQKDVRDAYRNGLERLGALLIEKAKVPARYVEEALESQHLGRQPLGAVLVSIGACAAHDVNLALEIQESWRAQSKQAADRLGEVLVEKRVVDAQKLQEPLLQHLREEKPLGRLLVENGVCKPEQIVGVLIERDQDRQKKFIQFLSAEAKRATPPPQAQSEKAPADGQKAVRKLSALSRARKQKDKN
jgi:hypothetical protein